MTTIWKLQKEYLPALAVEDFFLLLAHVLGTDRLFPLTHPEYILSPEEELRARGYFGRRLKREPVAYITGHKEFYGREFLVSSDTLIPRPETELLVEQVINRVKNQKRRVKNEKETTLIDIGTGSGNIIITLAKELPLLLRQEPPFHFLASDISSKALAIARKNSAVYHLEKKILFLQGDLLKPFIDSSVSQVHLIIVANLPYLSETFYKKSMIDVRGYEPEGALRSEARGFNHYFRLLESLKTFSKDFLSTTLFLEISPEQENELSEKIHSLFPHSTISCAEDLSGRKRLIQASV